MARVMGEWGCVNKKWEIVYVSLMQERTKIRKNERKWLDKAMESEEKVFRFPWIRVCGLDVGLDIIILL